MVVLIEGVVNVLPDPSEAPPVAAVYHLIVFVPVAERETVPEPQREFPLPTGLEGIELTVAFTASRVLTQFAFSDAT